MTMITLEGDRYSELLEIISYHHMDKYGKSITGRVEELYSTAFFIGSIVQYQQYYKDILGVYLHTRKFSSGAIQWADKLTISEELYVQYLMMKVRP